ncbi:(2Fe-2S)-binding protein [Streptomyces sp. WAC06614]|uniref:(2Fe-2S)-binding protein n=1 Tax=Streptomyces sp. WAC06614 TaxID=2487416 RepID=UPI000F7B09A4|nr:(2Fe-2S)-binding protein [Streptomyces sp. WAC06614]RSS78964.1 (2Fe-2S)-binding protein [Streptomyces sp. WAC06614]
MTVPVPPPAPPAPYGSPPAAAYARLTGAYPGLRCTERAPDEPVPRGGGWVGAAALAAGGAELDAFLAWDAAQVARDHGRPGRPDVVAGFGLHRYVWPAGLLFTVPWFLDRRVPRIPAEQVAFHRTDGVLSIRTDGFACLPDDPAAGLPGARVVPDEEALRAELRAASAAHLTPVVEGFATRMRRGPRALWGMVTDDLVEGLWYLAGLFGEAEERRARAELALLLPGSGTAPYPGGGAFRTLAGPDGSALPTRDRVSCCFFYTVRPEDTCLTCPRTCDADRITRLAAAAAA